MKIADRWSSNALSPYNTDWLAKLSSSRITHAPSLTARSNTPSLQANWGPLATLLPLLLPSLTVSFTYTALSHSAGRGRKVPSRSIISVCSLRLMRTIGRFSAAASASTMLVLPTPGLPYRSTAFGSTLARISLLRLRWVARAPKKKRDCKWGGNCGSVIPSKMHQNGYLIVSHNISSLWLALLNASFYRIWFQSRFCKIDLRISYAESYDCPVPTPIPSSTIASSPCKNANQGGQQPCVAFIN